MFYLSTTGTPCCAYNYILARNVRNYLIAKGDVRIWGLVVQVTNPHYLRC